MPLHFLSFPVNGFESRRLLSLNNMSMYGKLLDVRELFIASYFHYQNKLIDTDGEAM